jgi:hypothetical protein
MDKGKQEIAEALARAPNNLHIYDTCCDQTDSTDNDDNTKMDHTETEEADNKDDDNNSTITLLTHACYGTPELLPRDKAYVQDEPLATAFAASSAMRKPKRSSPKKGGMPTDRRRSRSPSKFDAPKLRWHIKNQKNCSTRAETSTGYSKNMVKSGSNTRRNYLQEMTSFATTQKSMPRKSTTTCNGADVRHNIDSY